jgi:hypothetical protein
MVNCENGGCGGDESEKMKGYVIDETPSLSALAFTDDLILLATTNKRKTSCTIPRPT